jgi:hypothetical protein
MRDSLGGTAAGDRLAMASDTPSIEALKAEFKRLGLNIDAIPGLIGEPTAINRLIARLRTLAPGATWRDVFPDPPAHWKPGQPETWATPYRPFGPYDYQELPTGPAVHVFWERASDALQLPELLSTARRAGWPVYGAGVHLETADSSRVHAMIILARGTTHDRLGEFVQWLETHPGVHIAAIPRTGTEDYDA